MQIEAWPWNIRASPLGEAIRADLGVTGAHHPHERAAVGDRYADIGMGIDHRPADEGAHKVRTLICRLDRRDDIGASPRRS